VTCDDRRRRPRGTDELPADPGAGTRPPRRRRRRAIVLACVAGVLLVTVALTGWGAVEDAARAGRRVQVVSPDRLLDGQGRVDVDALARVASGVRSGDAMDRRARAGALGDRRGLHVGRFLAFRHNARSGHSSGARSGSYAVSVSYAPTSGSQWKASSASTTLKVVAAKTSTRVSAAKITVGSKATLKASVTSNGAAPAGTVKFIVHNKGYTKTLSHGAASVSVSGLPVGTYSVTAVFRSSNSSVAGSSATTKLTVAGKDLGQGDQTGSSYLRWGWDSPPPMSSMRSR
jgi:hypothetical protein